jgi:hypothetical protein
MTNTSRLIVHEICFLDILILPSIFLGKLIDILE